MIRAVIFDCFGVLTDDTWRAFCNALPASADVAEARNLNRQYDAGLISREDFLTGVEEATGQRPRQIETLQANEIIKNTVLLDYIRTLKADYKVGLLSNIATNWVRDKFLSADEQSLFDEMIFSFEVHLAKPAPEIFELITERLGVQPNEAIMIDDIESYCEAARSVGMQAVCYQDFHQMRQELDVILAGNSNH